MAKNISFLSRLIRFYFFAGYFFLLSGFLSINYSSNLRNIGFGTERALHKTYALNNYDCYSNAATVYSAFLDQNEAAWF